MAAKADRNGLQAPQRRLGDELHRRDVRLQLVEARVLEAEALRDGERELVAR